MGGRRERRERKRGLSFERKKRKKWRERGEEKGEEGGRLPQKEKTPTIKGQKGEKRERKGKGKEEEGGCLPQMHWKLGKELKIVLLFD